MIRDTIARKGVESDVEVAVPGFDLKVAIRIRDALSRAQTYFRSNSLLTGKNTGSVKRMGRSLIA